MIWTLSLGGAGLVERIRRRLREPKGHLRSLPGHLQSLQMHLRSLQIAPLGGDGDVVSTASATPTASMRIFPDCTDAGVIGDLPQKRTPRRGCAGVLQFVHSAVVEVATGDRPRAAGQPRVYRRNRTCRSLPTAAHTYSQKGSQDHLHFRGGSIPTRRELPPASPSRRLVSGGAQHRGFTGPPGSFSRKRLSRNCSYHTT